MPKISSQMSEAKAVMVGSSWAINLRLGGLSFISEPRYATEAAALKAIWRINGQADLNAFVHGDPEVEADMARDPEWPAPTAVEIEKRRTPHVWDWRAK